MRTRFWGCDEGLRLKRYMQQQGDVEEVQTSCSSLHLYHAQVKHAYRQLCKTHHPDMHATSGDVHLKEEAFKEITEAYRRLMSSAWTALGDAS